MTVERKTVGATIKAAGEGGTFEAVIATLGVVDRDGDIVEPGAFGDATVSVLPSHLAHHVPLGKATIEERGDKAVAVGQFNLDIEAAADWHSALKFDLAHPPSIQQWSWDFRPIEATKDNVDGKAVRRLVQVDTKEVSPVLRGASVGSGTLDVKRLKADGRSDNDRRELLEQALGEKETDAEWLWVEAVFADVVVYTVRHEGEPSKTFERDFELADGAGVAELADDRREVVRETSYRPITKADSDPPGVKLADEIRWMVGDVDAVVKRVLELADSRKAEGRGLGEPVSLGSLDLAAQCAELDGLMKGLRDVAVEVVPGDEIAQTAVRFLRSEAALRGV